MIPVATCAERRSAVRLVREMLGAGAIYLATVAGGALAIKFFDPPQWAAAALTLASVGPALLMLRAHLRYLNGVDELERKVQSDGVLIAAGVVAFACLAYGQLEEMADFPHVSLMWVFPALCVVWSAAMFFVRRKYQ